MTTQKKEKKESLLLNLALNILVPTLILTKLSTAQYLGPEWAIVVALAFPIVYGIYDYFQRGKFNIFSGLGIISVLLTGGISLLGLDPQYIAIKEAAIPGIIGVITLVSVKTRYPLIKVMLFNDLIMQTKNILAALSKNNKEREFQKVLQMSSLIVALSFFLSSALNYILARLIVVSQPGTEAYASELGKMTAYSYVVITIPSISVMIIAMVYLFKKITKLTNLSFEEIFNETAK